MTAPAVVLHRAQQLLDGDVGATGSPRLAAFLARQALEQLIDERCRILDLDVPDANMRSRLVLLRALDRPDIADAATLAWNRLSAACHHHAYELSPTVGEVRHLCEVVATLLSRG